LVHNCSEADNDNITMTRTRQVVLGDIASRIAGVRRPHAIRVAIDGVDAAGKTTLADELAPQVNALRRPVLPASRDGYHNPQAVRRCRGALSPEGYFNDSFNYPALVEALLQPLGPGLFRRSVFDFRTDQSSPKRSGHRSTRFSCSTAYSCSGPNCAI